MKTIRYRNIWKNTPKSITCKRLYQSSISTKRKHQQVGEQPRSGDQRWKQNKKTPLRTVFDGSSKRKRKLSLNEVIHKGESFINKIYNILISSCTTKIVLMCDIQAAFLRIQLIDEHKDLCRFIWVKMYVTHLQKTIWSITSFGGFLWSHCVPQYTKHGPYNLPEQSGN